MGIILLALVGLYLLVSLGVVIGAMAYARKAGKSPKRWGWIAALVMYLIPFWDWIPTVAMHRYYCATEAGFWVYKTPEQWKKENPGVILASSKEPYASKQKDDSGYTEVRQLNQRFDWEVKNHHRLAILRVDQKEESLFDRDGNEVLARYVDFSTGYGNPMTRSGSKHEFNAFKFWLAREMCDATGDKRKSFEKQIDEIYAYTKGDGK